MTKRDDEMKLVHVTPEMAMGWLRASADWSKEHPGEKNRPISQLRVARLRVAIEAGEWDATNQGFLIGKGGVIIDGQHRITAIAQSGVACPVYVLFRDDLTSPRNLPIDIDGGARRKHWVLGVSRYSYVVANMILQFAAAGSRSKALSYTAIFPRSTIVDLSEYVEMIGFTTTATRLYSQTPVRAGAALAWQREHGAIEQYSALVSQNHAKMWPIVGYLGTQLSSAALKGQRLHRRQVLVRAWKAFGAQEKDRGRRLLLGPNDDERAHQDALRFLDEAGVSL